MTDVEELLNNLTIICKEILNKNPNSTVLQLMISAATDGYNMGVNSLAASLKKSIILDRISQK